MPISSFNIIIDADVEKHRERRDRPFRKAEDAYVQSGVIVAMLFPTASKQMWAPRQDLGETWVESVNVDNEEMRTETLATMSFPADAEQTLAAWQGRFGEIQEEINATVSEIYSLPRVTTLLLQSDLLSGFAMDITCMDEDGNPRDFNKYEQHTKACKMVKEDKPTILIGSPMCTAFCLLRHINYTRMEPECVRIIMVKVRLASFL